MNKLGPIIFGPNDWILFKLVCVQIVGDAIFAA